MNDLPTNEQPNHAGMLILRFFMLTSELNIFLPNGIDIDFDKFNSLGLSDKQRQNVLKLAEKRRSLQNLQIQLAQTSDRSNRDVLDDSDLPDKPKSQDHSKLLKRIELLESEVNELTENVSEALGIGFRTVKVDHSLFEHDAFGDGEVDDRIDYKRPRLSDQEKPTNPAIPPINESENLDSVTTKLKILYGLRAKHEQKIAQFESEKKLNEIAGEDDEIDPLDAFMATTAVDLVGESISKTESDLLEINTFIDKFESLKKFLSSNQTGTTSLDAAIQQQKRMREIQEKKQVEPIVSESKPRGTGTVWEDEFRKDEQVHERKKIVPLKSAVESSGPVKLNTSRAGLQVPGTHAAVSSPAHPVPSWKPPDEQDNEAQEKLRKKLGY